MVKKGRRTKTKIAVRQKAANQSTTRLGAALRALGGLGGSAVGGLIGMPMSGSAAGHSLGAALSRWLGSGDYTVGSNSIVNKVMKGSDSIPAMHQVGQTIVVRHKEYLGEIIGSENFRVNQSFELNPGNASTFPWLSGVAAHFQEYKIRGLVFHYVPTSGNAVSTTNAALGSVMMQTSYRSNDSPPSSKVEVLNEYCSNEAVPSEPFAHPVECDPRENPFNVQYVRTGAVPAGDSKLLYDLGVTHVAVSGQQINDKTLGDLWISYEIELKKPILESNVTNRAKSVELEYTGGPITSTTFFIGSPARQGQLDVTAAGRVISFPKGLYGRFQVVVEYNGVVTGFSTGTATAFAGVVQSNISTVTNGGSVSRNIQVITVLIPVPTSACQLTLSNLISLTGTLTAMRVSISQLSLL